MLVSKQKTTIQKRAQNIFYNCRKTDYLTYRNNFSDFAKPPLVFGSSEASYDISLINSYLLPILVSETITEPILIKKINQFITFKSGNVFLLHNLNFLRVATNLSFVPESLQLIRD